MAQVSNLTIKPQSGSDTTVFATWEFNENTSGAGGGGSSPINRAIQAGDTVTVNSGAVWYNGVGIASFVFSRQWIVLEVRGDRAVLNRDTAGQFAIMSAIKTSYLTLVGSYSAPTKASITNTLENYKVEWFYSTGDGVWFTGSSSNVTVKNATYSVPANASKVKVTVTPVSKTYESNGQQTSYWTGVAVSKEYLMAENPPDTPSTPTVTIDKFKLTVKLDNISDSKAEAIEFEIYNGDTRYKTGLVTIVTARAYYVCDVTAGGNYRVRARAINYVGTSKVYSNWSPYSAEANTIPPTPTGVKCVVESETSIKVMWNQEPTAQSFTVEYATKKEYFDSSSEVTSIQVQTNYAYITGMDPGNTWYFRVKATNKQGDSGWSDIVYKVLGTKPSAPTTWTLTNTVTIGQNDVYLYWTHNTEDGSKQSEAQIELVVDAQEGQIITVDTSKEEVDEDKDKIYSYKLDLTPYSEGAEILWRIRTKGITNEYSDWSVQRKLSIYAPPTSTMTIGDGSGLLTGFPFNISVNVGPSTQKAISYSVSITAEYSYYTLDDVGRNVLVSAGEEVYSKVFYQSSNSFSHDLMPDEIILENNQIYHLTVTTAMNSGLITSSDDYFTVTWTEHEYSPDATVIIDKQTLCAYIRPFCINYQDEFVPNIVLSVYRREYNGTFTKIADEIDNDGVSSVTDPHPALDFARYRIVARSKDTNVVGFTDLPGQPVSEPSIVIQWNEEWTAFDYNEQTAPENPPWTGSMIRIPYNVDVTENTDPDVELVKYIGRSDPVAYYGTQKGVSESWSVEIPAYDKETVYSLRRLANWSGDCYVRQPGGTGYNANVKVSFSKKHTEVTIPVSFTITKVAGGI